MKYLKKFETVQSDIKSFNYNIGDFVLLDLESIKQTNKIVSVLPTDEFVKIIKFSPKTSPFIYIIDFPTSGNGDGEFYITENNIKRKATQDDIEKYEIKKDINKYNL